ncbi:hypothetical protein [Paenibacillus sp. J5C2022]|uniref:hypothetical protein n=1 Tax=Paenibacillus sp. J5C2022 TaxID=2977129 RepID=UPI0021CF367B|nr:hypothetical protein [Paenibacillus sp. J5C2022]
MTGSVVPIVEPECITDVTDKFFVEFEPTPKDTFYMVVRHQDNVSVPGNAVSLPVTYNVGTYTGFTPPAPYEDWQRGELDVAASGTSAYQLHCTSGGMMMNSWDTTWQPVTGGGPNTSYGYEFSTPPRPWAASNSELYIQADLQLPWFAHWDNNSNGDKPVGQLSFVIYMHDDSTQTVIAVVMNIFDNRPLALQEKVMHDTFVSFASTYLGGTRYLTPSPYSGVWTNNTWSGFQFFRAVMTEDNLLNIVNDINSAHAAGLSTNPADYKLTSMGILQETFREDGDQISMGSSFKDFGAYLYTE